MTSRVGEIRRLRILAHLSDLHFGQLDVSTLPALRTALSRVGPDLVIVSGDLTQRARTREFLEARAFLDSLPYPKLVVPGNHDIPFFDVVSRFRTPLAKYRKHIGPDAEPVFSDQEIAVVGINTARSLTFKSGRIDAAQRARVCAHFADAGGTRVVVTHHPFAPARNGHKADVVGGAREAIRTFAQCRVDLVLSGHMHMGGVRESSTCFLSPNHSMLLVHAGTATSDRRRGQVNSCNIIRIARPLIAVDQLMWNARGQSFVNVPGERFQLMLNGWVRALDAASVVAG